MCNEVDYSDSYYYSDSDYYSDASDIEDDNNEFVKLEDILNNSTDDERYEPLRDYETKYEILYFAPHTIRNIKTHTPISTRILPSRYVQVCLRALVYYQVVMCKFVLAVLINYCIVLLPSTLTMIII